MSARTARRPYPGALRVACAGALIAAIAGGCGPKPKTPLEIENETTAAEVLRLVPADVDLLLAARSMGEARDLGEKLWRALLAAEPLRTLMADEMEREVRRDWPDFKTFDAAELSSFGFRLAGGVATFERGNWETGKVNGFLVPVADQEKFLALFQKLLEAKVARATGMGIYDAPKSTAPAVVEPMHPDVLELKVMEPEPEPVPTKLERTAHPAGRGIVSFVGRDYSEFRWDIAFRDGYALLVSSNSRWVDGATLPPEPAKLPAEWLDLKPEASIWTKRFEVEFRDARRPHDALAFFSLTGSARKDLDETARRSDTPALVRDLTETRGVLFTAKVQGTELRVHGIAPNPMVGRLVKYFRAATGGGDPMRALGADAHDVYRASINLEEMYALLGDYEKKDLESGARTVLSLDFRSDIVGNFTGAFAGGIGPRWDQIVLAAGVRDDAKAGKVAEAIARSFTLMSFAAEEVGAKLAVSDATRAGKKVHDVALTPKEGSAFHLYVTAGKGIFLMTTDSAAVDRTLGDGAPALPAGIPSDATAMFGVDWIVSAYYRAVDPVKAVRAAATRLALPSFPFIGELRTFPAGLGPRERTMVDAFRYVLDRIYDAWGGYALRGDGFVMDFTLRTL